MKSVDLKVEIIQDGYSIICYKLDGMDKYALEYTNLVNNSKNIIYCDTDECKSIIEAYSN